MRKTLFTHGKIFSLDQVKELNKLIKQIIKGSSDYIKFQIFNNNQLCHKSSSLYKSLKKMVAESSASSFRPIDFIYQLILG